MASKEALEARIKQLEDVLLMLATEAPTTINGCSDGNCIVRKPKGMHTNGGCAHLKVTRDSTVMYERDAGLVKDAIRTLQWVRIEAAQVLKCTNCHGTGTARVGGPLPKGSKGGGQAFTKCWVCNGNKKYVIIEEETSPSI